MVDDNSIIAPALVLMEVGRGSGASASRGRYDFRYLHGGNGALVDPDFVGALLLVYQVFGRDVVDVAIDQYGEREFLDDGEINFLKSLFD